MNLLLQICALRRSINHSLDETRHNPLVKSKPFTSLDDSALRKAEILQPTRIVRNLNEFLTLDKTKEKTKEECVQENNSPDDGSEFFPMTTSMTRQNAYFYSFNYCTWVFVTVACILIF